MEDRVANRLLFVELDEVSTERDDLLVPTAESESADRSVPPERPTIAEMDFDEVPAERFSEGYLHLFTPRIGDAAGGVSQRPEQRT
jgi:hypothetical protein